MVTSYDLRTQENARLAAGSGEMHPASLTLSYVRVEDAIEIIVENVRNSNVIAVGFVENRTITINVTTNTKRYCTSYLKAINVDTEKYFFVFEAQSLSYNYCVQYCDLFALHSNMDQNHCLPWVCPPAIFVSNIKEFLIGRDENLLTTKSKRKH